MSNFDTGLYTDDHGRVHLVWDGEAVTPDQFREKIATLRAALSEAEKERDAAIAHDRQPYPTAEAYERVCAARTKWQARAEAAEKDADALAGALDRMRMAYYGNCIYARQALASHEAAKGRRS